MPTSGATAHFRHAQREPLEAGVTRNAPWLQADLGLRVMLGRFWLGAAVTSAPLERQWMDTLNLGVALFGA